MKNKILIAMGIGIAAALVPSASVYAEEFIPEKNIDESSEEVDFNKDEDLLDTLDVKRDEEAIESVKDDSIQEGTDGLTNPIWVADVTVTDNTPEYEYDNEEDALKKKEELEADDYETSYSKTSEEIIASEVETITKEEYEKTPEEQKLPIKEDTTYFPDVESDPSKATKEEYDKAEDQYKLPIKTTEETVKDFDGYSEISEEEYNRIIALPTEVIDGVTYYVETNTEGNKVYYKAYKEELENKSQCLIIAKEGSINSHLEGTAHIGTNYYYYDKHNNLKKDKVEKPDLKPYEDIVDNYYKEDAQDITWNTQGQYFYGEQTAVIDKGGIYKINATNASRISLQTSEKVVIIVDSKNDTGYIPTATTKSNFQPNQTGNQKWDFDDIFPNLTFVSNLKKLILTSNNNLGDIIAPKSKVTANSGNFCGQIVCKHIIGCAEGHTRKTEGKIYADQKETKQVTEYYLYNKDSNTEYTYQRYVTKTVYTYKVSGGKVINTSYYGEKKETPPDTPPETPDVPPETPDSPPETPDVPPVVPPAPPVIPPIPTIITSTPVITIADAEVPLAGRVLGEKRSRGQVLGAKRSRNAVLGARRIPGTADSSGILTWLSLFGLSSAGLGIYSKKRRGIANE